MPFDLLLFMCCLNYFAFAFACITGTTIVPTIATTADANINTLAIPNMYSATFTSAVDTIATTIMLKIKLPLVFFILYIFSLS